MTSARTGSPTRDTRLIWTGVALGSTALFGAFTVAPLIARDLMGSSAWSGIPGATAVAGTALGAAVLSPVMRARGRSAGLRLGYGVGLAGAIGAAVATGAGAFWALLVAMLFVGVGHASNQLARFAGADLHPPERRPGVIGWIVWSLTVGAVLGPTLPGLSGGVAEALALPVEASGFLIAIVFSAAALGVATLLRARPFDEGPSEAGEQRLGALLRLGHVRIALLALVASQSAMVLIMTITPLHVREGDHSLKIVGLVMSAHFIGMFAFSPLVGRLIPRTGMPAMIVAGLAVLAGGAVGAGSTSSVHSAQVGWWLFVLGLGWNMSFVAASAMLTQGLDYRARVTVQGGVEAVSWTASAVASATSGILLERFGYDILSFAGAALALPALLIVAAYGRARIRATHA